MKAIRVGIVDDHAITRRGLCEYLGAQEHLIIVGEAANGRSAIDLARRVPMNVMLLDIHMPGQSGLDAITHIRTNAPECAVLALSGFAPEEYGLTMLKKGAAGFLSKQCEPAEIITAINRVATGKVYLSDQMSELLAVALAAPFNLPHELLSARELQLFLRLAGGQTSSQIAQDLSISPRTASSYRKSICDKMELRSNSDFAYYAVKHGLIA